MIRCPFFKTIVSAMAGIAMSNTTTSIGPKRNRRIGAEVRMAKVT
jgi:hypothetical protein